MRLQLDQLVDRHADRSCRFVRLTHAAEAPLRSLAGHLCRTTGADPAFADDLVQETLAIAWTRFETLDNDCNFGLWTTGILRHITFGMSRTLVRRRRLLDLHRFAPLDAWLCESSDRLEARLDVAVALARLNRDERDLLLLFTLGGLSVGELAAMCDCREQCMRKRLERIRRKARSGQTCGSHSSACGDVTAETIGLLASTAEDCLPAD